jgi:DNA invertase Pin-like site-specific DNA recombinase
MPHLALYRDFGSAPARTIHVAQDVRRHLQFTFSSGEDNPVATLQLQMLGAFAQFERALILERQREGIAIARAAGKYTGRKRVLSAVQAAELR